MQLNKLTEKTLQSLRTVGNHHDGGGLYLQVRKSTAGPGVTRSWLFRYTSPTTGKPNWMGLGAFESLPLKDAREAAAERRTIVAKKIDPVEARDAERDANRATVAKRKTFDQCVVDCIEDMRAEWSSPKHAQQWTNTLMTYASPFLGSMPVAAITTDDVLKVLRPIWTEKTETATRVRQRVEQVLSWAAVNGFRTGDNPARWAGHLDNVLAKPSKVKGVESHPALPYVQIHDFVASLRAQGGTAARALEFQILTAARSGEVLGATWPEFDLEAAEWTVPAERMKAREEHRVPLAKRALEILADMKTERGGKGFVFPGGKKDKPLSNNAMLALLDRMNGAREAADLPRWRDPKLDRDIVPHGTARSTFRVWAGETTKHPHDVMERALAHTIQNKAQAAYDRTDLLDKRRVLMNDWAKFINTKPKANAGVTNTATVSR